MLKRLALRRFVFIDELSVEFAHGFCVLTGETGAGKSLLVDALSLLAGARPTAGMLMQGAENFEVEAEFEIAANTAAAKFLRNNDLLGDENEMIVRRVSGKTSRAYINGRQVQLSVLSSAVSEVVDICGQHNHFSLRRTAAQRTFVDHFAGADETVRRVRDLHKTWTAAFAALQKAQTGAEQDATLRATLQEDLVELQALQFSVEKWTEENRRLSRLAAVADLSAGSSEVLQTLEEQVLGGLSQARRRLSELLRLDDDAAVSDSLKCAEEAVAATEEAARGLSRYAEHLQSDPQLLEAAEQFVAESLRLARKHQLPDAVKLSECITEKEKQLSALSAQLDVTALRKAELASKKEYAAACVVLSKLRKQSASKLSAAAGEVLQQLAMPQAKLHVCLTPLDVPNAHGAEEVELKISTRKDAPPGGIADVASGGELSRLGLALQIAAAGGMADSKTENDSKPVTVFDEVDSGIGGAAAAVVGGFLQTLGRRGQVLCVTHLAQVAAHADNHWQVRATTDDNGKRQASILPLSAEERVTELARIVGGAVVSEAARAHAADLLMQARDSNQKNKK